MLWIGRSLGIAGDRQIRSKDEVSHKRSTDAQYQIVSGGRGVEYSIRSWLTLMKEVEGRAGNGRLRGRNRIDLEIHVSKPRAAQKLLFEREQSCKVGAEMLVPITPTNLPLKTSETALSVALQLAAIPAGQPPICRDTSGIDRVSEPVSTKY